MLPVKRKDSVKSSKHDGQPSKKQKLDATKTKKHNPKTAKRAPTPESSASDDDDMLDGMTGTDLVQDADMSGSEAETGAGPDRKPAKSGTTSAEAHAAQRVRAKERKANKPGSDMIMRLNKIGERLRRQSHVPADERKALVTELFDIITGNIRELVFKHDSVRVIQVGLKYANASQRLQIAQELKADYLSLAESKYGKFLVAKLIVEGDKEIRSIVIPSFYGHVRRLINHPEAAWIMDDIYRQVATSEQKALLLREWYSAEYAIQGKTRKDSKVVEEKPTADLATILAQSPEKKRVILQYLYQLINQLVQKKLTAFTMLHDAMLQYVLNIASDSAEHKEFFELLKSDLDDETTKATTSAEVTTGGDLLKSLAFTKSGARVVRLAFAYGSAKDRKVILRVYKDLMMTMAQDHQAHTVLLAAMDVMDDTKLSAKAIFAELIGDGAKEPDTPAAIMTENLVGMHSRVVMLYPLAGLAKSLFPGEQKTIMEELHAIRTTTSKKDPEIRRQELVKYTSPALLGLIANGSSTLETLVRTTFGPQAITEIMLGAHGDKTAACRAIADLCRGPIKSTKTTTSDDNNNQQQTTTHPALSVASGKMLKQLAQGGKFDPAAGEVQLADPPLAFADQLYSAISEHLMDWATGPNSPVVAALLESVETSAENKKAITKVLSKNRKRLEEAAKPVESPGKKATSKGKGDKKGAAGAGAKAVGGSGGVRILLGILDGTK